MLSADVLDETCPIENLHIGFRPLSADDVPILDRVPGLTNCFVNTGQGSKGWTLSAGCSRVVADMIDNRVDLPKEVQKEIMGNAGGKNAGTSSLSFSTPMAWFLSTTSKPNTGKPVPTAAYLAHARPLAETGFDPTPYSVKRFSYFGNFWDRLFGKTDWFPMAFDWQIALVSYFYCDSKLNLFIWSTVIVNCNAIDSILIYLYGELVSSVYVSHYCCKTNASY